MLNSWQAVLSVVCLSLSSVAVAAKGSTLEGKVFGVDGQPIGGADIRLESFSPRSEAVLTKTDVRGQYRFKNVAAGKYKVSVSSANVVHKFIPDVMIDGNKRVNLEISPVNSPAPTKEKHLVWVPPPTGTHIGGGRWKEVDGTGASVARVSKGDLNNMVAVSMGPPRNGTGTSVVGGTQGAFVATQIGVKPSSPH
jgi:hypothetical protein